LAIVQKLAGFEINHEEISRSSTYPQPDFYCWHTS